MNIVLHNGVDSGLTLEVKKMTSEAFVSNCIVPCRGNF